MQEADSTAFLFVFLSVLYFQTEKWLEESDPNISQAYLMILPDLPALKRPRWRCRGVRDIHTGYSLLL